LAVENEDMLKSYLMQKYYGWKRKGLKTEDILKSLEKVGDKLQKEGLSEKSRLNVLFPFETKVVSDIK
jgi:hypothetical protein